MEHTHSKYFYNENTGIPKYLLDCASRYLGINEFDFKLSRHVINHCNSLKANRFFTPEYLMNQVNQIRINRIDPISIETNDNIVVEQAVYKIDLQNEKSLYLIIGNKILITSYIR